MEDRTQIPTYLRSKGLREEDDSLVRLLTFEELVEHSTEEDMVEWVKSVV